MHARRAESLRDPEYAGRYSHTGDGHPPIGVAQTHLVGGTLYAHVCQGKGRRQFGLSSPCAPAALLREILDCGIWWGNAVGNVPAPLFTNLDRDLPGQAWDLLDMSRYRAHNWHCFRNPEARSPYASLQTSLGCPFTCSFCCINAPFTTLMLRVWSPDNVIGQIDRLVREYGVSNIKIPDEMFVLNRRHVTGICDRIIERAIA